MVLAISEGDVSKLVAMSDAVAVIEEAFRHYGRGETMMPPRMRIEVPRLQGVLRIMSAAMPGLGALGLKTLTGVPGRRMPEHVYMAVMLFDPEDGHLTCIMSASRLTQLRTGAAGGVAAKFLARADRSVNAAVIGIGVQGRAQLEALACVKRIETVNVFDAEKTAAEKFADQAREGFNVNVAASADEAVRKSDLIIVATTSISPVFKASSVMAGAHINAIGSNAPNRQEIDPSLLTRATVVVDSREQVLLEAGDLIQPIKNGQYSPDKIHAELSEVILGRKVGRKDNSEITLFKSVGIAVQDVALASWIYNEAVKRRVGQEVKFAA
jgi:alanine dehydrogenase